MDIIKEIKRFVESECRKTTSKYGYEFFVFHLGPMIKYVDELSDEFGGDKEVLFLATWLHDLGSTVYGRDDHHLTGAEIAEKKLKELNYPSEKIELVKKCILNHRGSLQNERRTIEEKIIAEADAMSNFDNITGIFRAALVYENKGQDEARKSVKKKLQNKWDGLHFDSSKRIIKPKYEAAMLLLE